MAYCRDGEMSFRQAISAASFTEIEAITLVGKGRGLYVPKQKIGALYYPDLFTGGTGSRSFSPANAYSLGRYTFNQSAIIDRLRFNVVTGAATNARVAMYDTDDFGYPRNVIFDSGNLSVAVAGVKTIGGLSIAIVRGVYYLGLADGTTGPIFTSGNPAEGFAALRPDSINAGVDANNSVQGWQSNTSAGGVGPPPNPMPAAFTQDGNVRPAPLSGSPPVIEVRCSATG